MIVEKLKEIFDNNMLSINQIKVWLVENENYCKYLINESNCRKWAKWLNNGEKPFPCVCPIREKDCVLIELYYKLISIEGILRHHEEALEDFKKINELEITLLEWKRKYKSIYTKNNLDTIISIKQTSEPYKVLKLKIEPKSFDSIRRFQKIYIKST